MFQYEAKVLEVIDGDTMKLLIDLGFHVHVEETIRLARIDTPEKVGFDINGIVDPAKTFVIERLAPGSVCIVNIIRAEKYGRWLADVFYKPNSISRNEIMNNGKCLNDELVAAGLAVHYDGGRKK